MTDKQMIETPEERELRRHRSFLSAEHARRCNECRGRQCREHMEEHLRRNEDAEMAKAYQRELWREEAVNAPLYVVSLEIARLCSRHSVLVEEDASRRRAELWIISQTHLTAARATGLGGCGLRQCQKPRSDRQTAEKASHEVLPGK